MVFQKGSLIRDVIGEMGEQTKKGAKEVVTEIAKTPVNLLGDLAPFNSHEYSEKKQKHEAKKAQNLAAIRSNLRAEVAAMKPAVEQPRVQQGAEMAERGQTNQQARMNNAGGQPLSASMTPKKKIEPLVVQQKRNNKLHGAG